MTNDLLCNYEDQRLNSFKGEIKDIIDCTD